MDYPADLFYGDCAFKIDGVSQPNMDAATNDTWWVAAPISSCTADLFAEGLCSPRRGEMTRPSRPPSPASHLIN